MKAQKLSATLRQSEALPKFEGNLMEFTTQAADGGQGIEKVSKATTLTNTKDFKGYYCAPTIFTAEQPEGLLWSYINGADAIITAGLQGSTDSENVTVLLNSDKEEALDPVKSNQHIPLVNARSSAQDKIALWQGLFRCRTDAYGARYQQVKNGEVSVGYRSIRESLTSEVVEKHLTGEQPILVYVVLEDHRSVYFGAFDLDNKAHRPQHAQTFEDVKRIVAVASQLGLKYMIARSTGRAGAYGYHIYLLLDEPYSMYRLRAIMFHVLELSGHLEEHRRQARELPEVFPKLASGNNVGMGIRPPLSAPGVAVGRNCVVDDNDVPEGDQWAASARADAHRNSVAHLDAIIKAHNLKVHEEKNTTQRSVISRHSSLPRSSSTSRETIPLERLKLVLHKTNGCLALYRIALKARSSVLTYDEGSAFLTHITPFKGWRRWWTQVLKIVGWDDTPEHKAMTDDFLAYDYKPFSCAAMQGKNLCPFKNSQHCFLQKYRQGELVEPSPHRLAYGEKHRRDLQINQEAENGSKR